MVIDGREVFAHASIGVAFAGTETEDPEELVRNADAAMYVVKTDGKGRYAIFEPHMHAAPCTGSTFGPAFSARWTTTSSCCTTSRSCRWRPDALSGSRRWCGGSTRSVG